ncbi:MAG: hypothetical protein NTZ05_23310, partial [Chloroflexi bacterium]|nr:hypothetical protein [Chloroflexota bacterium]
PKEFPLKARFGMKGAYTADLIPTKAGAYIFHFTGTINGQQVTEKFESGPGRFNDVQAPTALQFPEPVQTAGEMQRLVSDASARATAAEAVAGQARMIGFGGIFVGVLGLLAGGAALMAARRPVADAPTGAALRAK